MTTGRFTGSHARTVEVQRQMLPFRFGVYSAVTPTTSAWRDQARTAEDLDARIALDVFQQGRRATAAERA
jgi:hypothetical protein